MRTIVAWIMTLAVAAGTSGSASAQLAQGTQAAPRRANVPASAKPAQATPAPADPNAEKALQEAFLKAREEMNTLLDEWEMQSKKIFSLDVEFERIDKEEVGKKVWGDQYFKGRAMLRSPDLACLEFTKIKLDPNGKPLMVPGKDGKPTKAVEAQPTERIVCTGKEVLQYTWDDQKIFVFPLDKQVRQKTLQQGPLPFLFNMKAEEAKQRYTMTLRKQDAKEYLIEIVPKMDIDRESFKLAFLWLSKETFLPNQLWLFPVGNKEHQEFRFVGERNTIKPNVPMKMDFFAFTQIPGWKVILNPGQAGQPAPANPPQGAGAGAGAQPKRPVAQPAMRPTTRPQ